MHSRKGVRRGGLLAAVGLLLALGFNPGGGHSIDVAQPASALQLRAHVPVLPVAFEANHGQTSPHVRFMARGRGYALFLTDSGITLRLQNAGANAQVLGFQFLERRHPVHPQGEGRLQERVNYFIGKNPRHWHADIPTYRAVRYPGVAAGVDLTFYSRRGQPEYDWLLHAGASANRIHMRVVGQGPLRIGRDGGLVSGDLVIQDAPIAYQQIGVRRVAVPAQYGLRGRGAFTVALGKHDSRFPVTIDPVLRFAAYLAPQSDATSVAFGSDGSAYIAGTTSSPVFPGPSPIQVGIHDARDSFVGKLAPSGSRLVWGTYLSGTDTRHMVPNLPQDILTCGPSAPICYDPAKYEALGGVAVDRNGNVFVTGQTNAEDFPMVHAAHSSFTMGLCPFGRAKTATRDAPVVVECGDAYAAKIGPAGDRLIYSTYLGGDDQDEGLAISVDASGSAVITGETWSANFPTSRAIEPTLHGAGCLGNEVRGSAINPAPGGSVPCSDAFVARFTPDGAILFSTLLGGENVDRGTGIAYGSGGIYVAGTTFSQDFPTHNAFQVHGDITGAAFVTKLTIDGTGFIYSTYIGGTDVSPHLLGVGQSSATDTPEPEATPVEDEDPPSGLEASGLAVDSAGDAYITGDARTRTLPLRNAVQPNARGTNVTAFVTELAPAGSALVYSTYLGGSGGDHGNGIAVDSGGDAYVVGTTESTDFPAVLSLRAPPQATGECTDPLIEGQQEACSDVFVTRIGLDGRAIVYSTYLGGSGIDEGNAIALDNRGNALVVGDTYSPDFGGAPPLIDPGDQSIQSGFAVELYDPPSSTPTPLPTDTPTSTATPTATATATRTLAPAPAVQKKKKCKKGFKRVKGKCKKVKKHRA